VIANGENAAGGFGLTGQTADEMFAAGVDFITSGNHIWDSASSAARSMNRSYHPPATIRRLAGRGSGIIELEGVTVGVLNVMGRVFMPTVDDPFRVAREMVDMLRMQTMVVVVDVHAEATSEKMALARFLDGSVSFVYGSHTHVQTADEQILDGGTATLPTSDDGSVRRRHRHGNGRRAATVHAGLWRTVQRAEDRAASVLCRPRDR